MISFSFSGENNKATVYDVHIELGARGCEWADERVIDLMVTVVWQSPCSSGREQSCTQWRFPRAVTTMTPLPKPRGGGTRCRSKVAHNKNLRRVSGEYATRCNKYMRHYAKCCDRKKSMNMVYMHMNFQSMVLATFFLSFMEIRPGVFGNAWPPLKSLISPFRIWVFPTKQLLNRLQRLWPARLTVRRCFLRKHSSLACAPILRFNAFDGNVPATGTNWIWAEKTRAASVIFRTTLTLEDPALSSCHYSLLYRFEQGLVVQMWNGERGSRQTS